MSSLILDRIDPRWVDVVTGPDGTPARGCRPMTPQCRGKLPIFEEVFSRRVRDYPRSDWDDLLRENTSLETLIRWIHDQLQEGTCASNMVMCAFETCLNMTLGPANGMMMSPISVYRWIASGPQSGSGIVDNVVQMQQVGALPVDTPENRARLKAMGLPEHHVLQHTGYYQKFPSGWQETAAHFQIVEAYRATTFEGCVSGLFDDFTLCYGRAGHAICGVTPAKSGSTYYIKYANSWGKWGQVGDNGLQMFGYDSESFLRNAIATYGAVLIRSVKVTEQLLQALAA